MDSNIINYRDYMESNYKVYVDVNEDRLKDGRVVPRSFVWEDGNCYEIDRVLDVRPAASLKAGGVGLRYKVSVNGHETHLYLEEGASGDKWFMERKSL